MDKTAIQQIQESANIPALMAQIDCADNPVAILPSSMGLASLEKFMDVADRYRLNFSTDNIEDFCRYNKTFDQVGARCFIDAEHMAAKTIFDLGTEEYPLHQENSAKISLKKTALFQAITQISGLPLHQKAASEFIEDWGQDMTAKNNEDKEMRWPLAAKALRDLTIESAREINSKVSNFGESMSAMERIEAKNQSAIPAFLTFKCAPYPHLSEREFTMRVSILAGDDKPQVTFRLMQLEKAQEEMATEFKEILTASFKDCALEAFIGTI